MLQLDEEQNDLSRKDIKKEEGDPEEVKRLRFPAGCLSAGSIPKPRHKPCRAWLEISAA